VSDHCPVNTSQNCLLLKEALVLSRLFRQVVSGTIACLLGCEMELLLGGIILHKDFALCRLSLLGEHP